MLDLHGAEVRRVDRERQPVAVGPSSIIGLVGSAPDRTTATAAAGVFGEGASGIRITADAVGVAGNAITLEIEDPKSNSAALAINVVGKAIRASLATTGTGAISTTAAQLVTAINNDAAASVLVTAEATGAGSGKMTAAAAAPLAGGTDPVFPADTPVLLTTAAQAASLGQAGALAAAVRDVFRAAGAGGAAIVVVRTEDDAANILAGSAANKTGVYALLSAESTTGQRPRLIAAPGARADAVTTALQAVAADLRATAVVTLQAADAAAAIAAKPDLSRVIALWPEMVIVEDGAEIVRPADALVLGHVARIDRERSFAASPSNHQLRGVLRTAVPVDWTVDSRTSAANLLNRAHIVTAIRRGAGTWLWGNRLSDGTLIPRQRADDIISDQLLDSILDYIDRRVDLPFVEHITGRLNNYLRGLVVAGHIRAGRAWFDAAHNDAATLANAQVTFSFEITLHDIAEHIVIRSSVSSVPNEIINQLTA